MNKWTNYEIDKAKELISKNVTYKEIASILGRSPSALQAKMHALGIKSNFLSKSFVRSKRWDYIGRKSKFEAYDWKAIQIAYDSGETHRSLLKLFNISCLAIRWAKTNGKLKLRSIGEACRLYNARVGPRKVSDETRAKISVSRKRYLDANPDKVPYLLNHSSKVSFPEKIFMDELNRRNITGWCYNFQVSRYTFDIAFEAIKLDVEIDGGSHLQEKVAQKDAERDAFSRGLGWTVLRFTAKEVQKDLKGCVDRMQEVIVGMR